MNIFKIIKNMYLCWKYPFLYPRNRFTDRYTANKLNKLLWKLKAKAFITFNIGVHHVKVDQEIQMQNTREDVESLMKRNGIHYSVIKNNLVLWKENPYYRYNINLGFNPDIFTFKDINLKLFYSGNQHISITIYVTKNEEDGHIYGWPYHEQNCVINKFAYKWYTWIKWIDENIVDPIYGLFPTWNELEAMPNGWKKAFGLEMCKEIKQALLKDGGSKFLHTYRIMQIKEKWGSLCWYDTYSTKNVQNIIRKYENLSYKTCISCGKPAKYRTVGWVCPYCEDCAPIHNKLAEIK